MSVGTLAVREQTFITRIPLGMGWYDLEAHMLTSILPHSENKSSSTQKPVPADTEEGHVFWTVEHQVRERRDFPAHNSFEREATFHPAWTE